MHVTSAQPVHGHSPRAHWLKPHCVFLKWSGLLRENANDLYTNANNPEVLVC